MQIIMAVCAFLTEQYRLINELHKRVTVQYYEPYEPYRCRFQWLSTDNEWPLQHRTITDSDLAQQ